MPLQHQLYLYPATVIKYRNARRRNRASRRTRKHQHGYAYSRANEIDKD
jgi:hypothetical protein